jgi:hypothetical protein
LQVHHKLYAGWASGPTPLLRSGIDFIVKHIRLAVVVVGVVVAAMAAAPSAGASGAQTPATAPTTTTLPGSTAIDRNFAFTGATVTSPADPTPRSLNGYQTAVFVQSWLPLAYFGKPELRDPPADVPVYRLDIMGSWGGDQPQIGYQTVYYASDGTDAFVSYPQNQAVSPTPTEPPPPPTIWFVPPPRTIDAFNGTATLIETGGTQQARTPRTAPTPTGSGSSSTSTPWVLYGLLVAAAAVIVVGVVIFFRRRRDSDHFAAAR